MNYLYQIPRNILVILSVVFLLQMEILAQEPESTFDNKKNEYGFSLGILFPGVISFSDSYSDFNKPSSILIKGFYDSYLIPGLSTGLTLMYSYSVIEEKKYNNEVLDHHASILEIGVSIKRRFILTPKWALKPGVNIGYRKFFFNFTADCDMEINDAHGLGMNASLEVQYNFSPDYILFGELGFVSQPYGGKEDITYLEFGPILYLTVGVTF